MPRSCMFGFVLLLSCRAAALADEPVFSGPQVGEQLPSFKAKGVFGDLADKEFDLIEQSEGKSIALIFFHARTRPAQRRRPRSSTLRDLAGTPVHVSSEHVQLGR